MPSVPLATAKDQLEELIDKLLPGEELHILKDDRTVARLIGMPKPLTGPRKPGSAIGRLFIVKEDDDHLEDFKDYMP